jgi:hypothetical protein
MNKEETVFEKLSKVNVNDKTDKKGKFTYLSWAFAWGELKKVAPDAKVSVYHNEADNMPYFVSDAGAIVKVGVEIDGIEHISFLPLMDFKNKAIGADTFDMMDVNKAIQRATVKAIGLHGLGLYIYAGEDLPEEERSDEPKKTSSRTKKDAPKKEAKEEKPKRERRTRSKANSEEEASKEEDKSESDDAPKEESNFRRRRSK